VSQLIRQSARQRLLMASAVLIAASIAVAPAHAQILYGSIVGTVTDAQGANVPGATVTIVNKETNLTRDTVSDNEGNFNLTNVLAGQYDVKISLTGFREAVRTSVPVSIGQIARVDMTLQVGTLSEVVTVHYQALLNLVPGTSPMAFGNAETDTPARSLATNVNGQANTVNSTRTDGATNMNIWLPNHNMYISPAETVDTVNVSTSSFDAEQGNAGGAAVTVITKSGTNQLRGAAFEFYNGDSLNARPYYFGSSEKPPMLPLKQNNFGGTLGGPIKRDKVFFFGSFEGYKREYSLPTFFSVPDAALRSGDFSGATNNGGTQQIIYNPSTGDATGAGRAAFDNNRIPTGMINPIAQKIMNLYPMPNTGGTGLGGLTNNYTRNENRTVDRQNYDLKVNFNRSTAHQIWGKFSYMNAVVDDLTNYLGPDPNATGDGGDTKVYQATAGQTWTLKPTLLMDMTFGFGRQDQTVLGPDFNSGNYGLETLGIPGTNDQGIGDQRYAGYPQFVTGFSDVGNRDGWNPIYRDERTYSLATNVTKVAGRHDIRGGYFMNFLYLDHWQPETGNPRGRFTFNGNTTGLRGGQTTNFYNQYASFMLGLVGNANKSVQNELMTSREWQHALYIRDRWNVNSRLTLDLGLRWEYYPIMARADGRGLDRLDLTNLEVIVAGRGNNPQSNGMSAGLDNFAPRLGGVFRLNDKTVFRSGYGVTYNAQAWARAVRGDNDYPVTIAGTFQNAEQFLPYGTLQQGIPFMAGPDLSSGRVPLDRSAAEYTPEIDNIDRGYIHTWNVAFERRLPYDVSVDVAYVGAKGVGGYAGLDINAPTTLGGGDASRPYFGMGRIQPIWSWGARLPTKYQSLQVALNKPFTRGFMFKGAYTLSKAMNYGTDADGRATLTWNTPSELERNWSPAGFDRRHNFQMGFAWALPGQSVDGSYNSIGHAIFGDWQLNGVIAAFTGSPFTMGASGTVLNTPSNSQTADQVGDYNILGNIGNAGKWFDTASFVQPTGVRFGNTGRNQFYGPGAWTTDLSIFRSFALGGQRRLEARVQGNNIFNHPVFGNPSATTTSGTFGQITAFGQGGGSYIERQFQVGVRFTF
jgi:Carboxypeptidase regulatory-like domain/TonB dependent receptor